MRTRMKNRTFKSVAVVAMSAVMFVSTTVWGGIVTFDPLVANLPPEGGTAIFDVFLSVEDLEEGFDAANLVFGSDTLSVDSFVYADSFANDSEFVMDPPIPAGFYGSELRTGGFAPSGAIYGTAGVAFGTITVSVRAFDPVGTNAHGVFVESRLDAGTSSLILDRDAEELSGFGVVNVAPEPAALTLLGLSMLGFLRRH